MKQSTTCFAFLAALLSITLLLTHLSLTDARRGGGGSRSSSRGSSRGGWGSSRSSSSSKNSGSRSWTYSQKQTRTISGGRRVVGYRSIRPVSGATLTVFRPSPIVYRPRFYVVPVFYGYHRPYYYYSSHHRVKYRRQEKKKTTTHLIFANLKTYCSKQSVYGINGNEEYIISALYHEKSTNTSKSGESDEPYNRDANANLTSSCSFAITAPDKALLRVNFSASACKSWPKDCKITVKDLKDNSILLQLNSANKSGKCFSEVYSNSNIVSFSIFQCSGNLSEFAYSLSADVAVLIEDENKNPTMNWKTALWIVFGNIMGLILVVCLCTWNRRRRAMHCCATSCPRPEPMGTVIMTTQMAPSVPTAMDPTETHIIYSPRPPPRPYSDVPVMPPPMPQSYAPIMPPPLPTGEPLMPPPMESNTSTYPPMSAQPPAYSLHPKEPAK